MLALNFSTPIPHSDGNVNNHNIFPKIVDEYDFQLTKKSCFIIKRAYEEESLINRRELGISLW